MVSDLSGYFVHSSRTWKKNRLCTWKKNSQHSQDVELVLHVSYQGSTCHSWHPNLLSGPHVELCFDLLFFIGSILWLYQTQGLFIICTLDTDVTENTHGKGSFTAGHTQKSLSFFLLPSTPPAVHSTKLKYLKYSYPLLWIFRLYKILLKLYIVYLFQSWSYAFVEDLEIVRTSFQ